MNENFKYRVVHDSQLYVKRPLDILRKYFSLLIQVTLFAKSRKAWPNIREPPVQELILLLFEEFDSYGLVDGLFYQSSQVVLVSLQRKAISLQGVRWGYLWLMYRLLEPN